MNLGKPIVAIAALTAGAALGGLDVTVLSERELTLAYFGLAKQYHPDHSKRRNHELMANINAARTIIRKAHFHRK